MQSNVKTYQPTLLFPIDNEDHLMRSWILKNVYDKQCKVKNQLDEY